MNIILPWHFVIAFWQPQWPDPERCIKLPQSLSTLQYSSPAENNLFKFIWVFASSTIEAAVCLASLPVWLSGLLIYWDWKSCDLWLPGLVGFVLPPQHEWLASGCDSPGMQQKFFQRWELKTSQTKTSARCSQLSLITCLGLLEFVASFTYLGSLISKYSGTQKDISARQGKANIWTSKQCSLKTKVHLYNSNIIFILMYGSECWQKTKANMKRWGIPQQMPKKAGWHLQP